MVKDNLFFYEKIDPKNKVAVFGVPIDLGKENAGTSAGPDYLRKNGLMEMFSAVGFAADDLGNIDPKSVSELEAGNPKVKFLKEIVRVAHEIAKMVHHEILGEKKVVVIGGDQSVSFGTIAGASEACNRDLGIIWIDAHADLMTDKNTLSGNVHGMPAAAAMGIGHPDLVNVFKSGAKIAKENFLFIGLKDLDQGEVDLIRSEKLNVITMMDIIQKGFGQITEAVDSLNKRVKNIWVCFDLDVVDKNDAPASLMATSGGLNYREITSLAKYIGRKCQVVGMELVELAPGMDIENKTAKLSLELVAYFLGGDFSWYSRYMKNEAERLGKLSI